MQNAQTLSVTTLSLPKGGGALNGMGESLNTAGPDGLVSLSLPLPVSAGRGVAPGLSLTYSSGAGNGPFGMGWQCGVMSISRRTQHGVPRYDEQDTFLSPSGEVMVVAADEDGQPDSRQSDAPQSIRLSSTYTVTRYHPRQIQDFSKLEFWQPVENDDGAPFWLMSTPDGQTHIFGKTAQARISHRHDDQVDQIAQWLLEESVTPTGEHIYYQYKAEDDAACDEEEKMRHPNAGAQKYLYQVHYGNITPQNSLFVLEKKLPSPDSWLFHLVFDYGERSDSLSDIPPFETADAWPCRLDCFSRYEYGFELRTRRLCRQVLMYHRLRALAGEAPDTEEPALVSRMILDYDPQNCVTTLIAVTQVGHESDGTPVALPPLEFEYARFEPESLPGWQAFAALDNFTAQHPYQLVDLMGEGLPGVLYQDKGAWWYKAPQRKEGGGPNDISYGQMIPLPAMPSLQGNVALMDINGDGQMDWVVTQPGMQGYYSRQPDGQWTRFTPLNALPVEYFHPRAQLADLVGDGLPDLALVGPKSVRLYANHRDGFARGQDVAQPDGVTLPIPNAHTLVAFSDMLGSGQQHLVAVSVQGVTCWPNLGHGRFGQPLEIPGFNPPAETFNPDFVFLADIDGSGTTDLIYALSDRLEIYLNESGNRFSKSLPVPLPDGVRFDNTCLLQIADIQGLGIASLVLTVPHMAPNHWRCDLKENKPWLLNTINNNMGTHHELRYRSSAQFWLDEKKAQTLTDEKPAACYLPFPIHCLWQTDTLDEITGNRLVATLSYALGAWDGREREFRGFGYVEQRDTDELAIGDAPERTPPTLTKSWFATGLLAVDEALIEGYWRGDKEAFTGFTPRFTTWSSDGDDPFEPKDEQQIYWLQRGLKGQLLRSELYGLDGADNAETPYTVNESRYQVRCLPANGEIPIVLVSAIESRSYVYERIASDPQCTHSIQLELDAFGFPIRSVNITYPRRPKPTSSPYPSSLPASLFDDSYDDQQHQLRLTLQRNSWHHLTEKEDWVLGIANGQRNDAYDYAESAVPKGGLALELLQKEDSLIADGKPRTYLGQQRVFYTNGKPDIVLDKPTVPVLVAFSESAVLDKISLVAFDGVLTEEVRNQALEQGGYVCSPRLFDDEDSVEQVWCARQGYTDYGSAAQFWRPMTQRNTLLTGKTVLDWDTYYCVVVVVTDAAGLTSQAEYDYRFLTPVTLTDANDNRQAVTLDALGRVSSQRFWGTEAGKVSGYSTPQAQPFTPPVTVEAALALTPGIPVAQSFTIVADSWMSQFSDAQITSLRRDAGGAWNSLIHHKVITKRGQLCQLAYQRWVKRQPIAERALISLAELFRQPPHICLVTTDRYDSDKAQQLRQQVAFSDGFGRPLQNAIRHAPGLAYQRAEDGYLIADQVGAANVEETDTRWAVTGRVEHNNKGQPVRVYQPYYLNDWKYVSNDSARTELFADTHFYDPLGREYKVLTAKGDVRRYQAFPWFTVSEDENDTAADVNR